MADQPTALPQNQFGEKDGGGPRGEGKEDPTCPRRRQHADSQQYQILKLNNCPYYSPEIQ